MWVFYWQRNMSNNAARRNKARSRVDIDLESDNTNSPQPTSTTTDNNTTTTPLSNSSSPWNKAQPQPNIPVVKNVNVDTSNTASDNNFPPLGAARTKPKPKQQRGTPKKSQTAGSVRNQNLHFFNTSISRTLHLSPQKPPHQRQHKKSNQ